MKYAENAGKQMEMVKDKQKQHKKMHKAMKKQQQKKRWRRSDVARIYEEGARGLILQQQLEVYFSSLKPSRSDAPQAFEARSDLKHSFLILYIVYQNTEMFSGASDCNLI